MSVMVNHQVEWMYNILSILFTNKLLQIKDLLGLCDTLLGTMHYTIIRKGKIPTISTSFLLSL